MLASAVIYISVNMLVARLATWLEGRMRRSPHIAQPADGGDVAAPDLAARAAFGAGGEAAAPADGRDPHPDRRSDGTFRKPEDDV
ncbi:hypothetical protein [Demequina litorisediminis]|uniref:hypothetical protein n=1 Tax=Demequina litorisediminis TaxID=1849022 RepID=UPI0024E07078|nr:hypothetical protein [Demequina litorisediminis]